MLTLKMKRRIKRKMSTQKPTIWIGKHGTTKETLAEIDRQLEREEVVKVKVLKTAIVESDAKSIADETARRTRSVAVAVRGHTFVLYRKREKGESATARK